MKALIALLIFTIAVPTYARVFSITQASFATYFKGTAGISQLQKHPYEKTSGTQTLFSDDINSNFSGEFGIIFPSKDYSLRLGLQLIRPYSPSTLKGKDSSGTELLEVDTSVLGIFPMAHFEYYLARNNLGRVYFSVGGGYGRVSLTNDYTFTAAGDALYSPLTSFKERSSQYTYIVETSIGYEMSFIQAVTFSFDLGYRYSVARELKYNNAGTNFIGTHPEDAPVLNSDGTAKSLDLGGVFTGLSFRFYFP